MIRPPVRRSSASVSKSALFCLLAVLLIALAAATARADEPAGPGAVASTSLL